MTPAALARSLLGLDRPWADLPAAAPAEPDPPPTAQAVHPQPTEPHRAPTVEDVLPSPCHWCRCVHEWPERTA